MMTHNLIQDPTALQGLGMCPGSARTEKSFRFVLSCPICVKNASARLKSQMVMGGWGPVQSLGVERVGAAVDGHGSRCGRGAAFKKAPYVQIGGSTGDRIPSLGTTGYSGESTRLKLINRWLHFSV